MEDVNKMSKDSVRVKEKGFMGSNHKVTGEEFNKLIEDNRQKILEINNIVYEQKCLMEKLCYNLNVLDDKYAHLYIELIISQIEKLLDRFQDIEKEQRNQFNEWNIRFEIIKKEIANNFVSNDTFTNLEFRVNSAEEALSLKEDIIQLQSNNEALLERVKNLEKEISIKSFFDTIWYKASVGVVALVALGISIFSIL